MRCRALGDRAPAIAGNSLRQPPASLLFWTSNGPRLKVWVCKWLKFGGASRDRTDDLIVANDALSQLSYSPVQVGSIACSFYQPSGMRTKPIPIYTHGCANPLTNTS